MLCNSNNLHKQTYSYFHHSTLIDTYGKTSIVDTDIGRLQEEEKRLFFRSKSFVVFLAFVLALQASFLTVASNVSAATTEQFQVSTGVKYKRNDEVINTRNQSVRVMEVNLLDPYTRLDLRIPRPLNSLSTTSSYARVDHRDGNRIVGAINGSFFDMSSKLPMYLISYNNVLVNAGIIASGRDQFVNEPIAFGIDSQGKALIDSFQFNLTATHAGITYPITSMNKTRSYDNLILYTPEYGTSTNTNQYGMEVVFRGASKTRNLAFGDIISATVSEVRPYGQSSTIPEDGFVLSANGDKLPILKAMVPGDKVDFSIQIDDKWKNSKYMLTSGPRLVENGAVSLSIDPNSSRATERAPRTAVAIDQTGTKVFMVTVDGRQSGYSSGMTLTEFAQYLVKLGAYKALNLDGGGSTTMITRRHGKEMASLMNVPSDPGNRERAVHTTLQAISTAPLGQPTYFEVTHNVPKTEMEQGTSANIQLKYVLDQYFNPLIVDPSQFKLSSNVGIFNGTTFTATTVGEGRITVSYGNLVKEIPVKVKPETPPFADIPNGFKYYTELKYLKQQNVIQGYADNTYRPETTLKRIDAVLLLARSLKLDTTQVKDVNFIDVPKTYRFYNEVAAVVNAGIIKGKDGGTRFDPNAPITRAEMAVILQRGFKLTGEAEVPFTDVPQSSFAYNAIVALVANDVTKGYADGTFKPNDTVTRMTYALFLYRILA
jgi:exopolysaccharide biosynthesis protein